MSRAAATVAGVPRARVAMIAGLAALAALVVAMLPPIAQDPAYHHFADRRTVAGIPHAWNVLSNVGFVLVGVAGLTGLWPHRRPRPDGPFTERWETAAALIFAWGVLLTGAGSIHYHLAPDNARLVWDRLPMTLVFMTLAALVAGDRVGSAVGRWLFGPLLAVGVASVVTWHATEAAGRGDLRLYALVQFLPMVVVPLLLVSCPARFTGAGWLWGAMALNAAGKLFELADHALFALGAVVSGHTIKHLLMAAATGLVLRMLVVRRRCSDDRP